MRPAGTNKPGPAHSAVEVFSGAMRLKTKLVAAIAGLVFVVAAILSLLYMSQLLQQHIDQSYESTDVIAPSVAFCDSDGS